MVKIEIRESKIEHRCSIFTLDARSPILPFPIFFLFFVVIVTLFNLMAMLLSRASRSCLTPSVLSACAGCIVLLLRVASAGIVLSEVNFDDTIVRPDEPVKGTLIDPGVGRPI